MFSSANLKRALHLPLTILLINTYLYSSLYKANYKRSWPQERIPSKLYWRPLGVNTNKDTERITDHATKQTQRITIPATTQTQKITDNTIKQAQIFIDHATKQTQRITIPATTQTQKNYWPHNKTNTKNYWPCNKINTKNYWPRSITIIRNYWLCNKTNTKNYWSLHKTINELLSMQQNKHKKLLTMQ